MPWDGVGAYLAVLAVAVGCWGLARLGRFPVALVALAVGLGLGRPGAGLVTLPSLQAALPGVMFHVAAVLGVLGFRLGQGLLRLPLPEIFRRSLSPLLLATVWLGAGALLLPTLLPEAAAARPFYRFTLPLALVTAVFALLSLRDVRGRAPADAGSLFFVAAALVGAAYSFTPTLLWSQGDPRSVWRQPLLVLVESGALGFLAALLWVAATRRARLPRFPVTVVLAIAAMEVAFSQKLWPPFTALGFGAALGKMSVAEWRLPGTRAIFSEAPFVLIVAAAFAPDLWKDSMSGPSLLHLAALAALLVLVRAKAPGGRALVTGPGLLFLGLALTVRLDRAMGPITRYVVDFALPAWAGLRVLMWILERPRGAARPGAPAAAGAATPPAGSPPTSSPRTSPSGDPPRRRGSGPA
jgi:hypothetical protein